MDTIIENYTIIKVDDDLVYCSDLAYQKNMSNIIDYDKQYFENYINRENTEISIKLNLARTSLTEKYCKGNILDIGIGSGEFIKSSKLKVYGYDINPYGIQWLKSRNLFIDPYQHIPDYIEGITLWDTMEHIVNPQTLLRQIREGVFVFISLPVFQDVFNVKKSKHFKPNEHLYYFTEDGMVNFMKNSGFEFLEKNDAETKAGRESVTAFVFKRSLSPL